MTERRFEPLDKRIVLGFAMTVGMAAEMVEQRVRGCVTVTHAYLRRPVLVSQVVSDPMMAQSIITEIRVRLESHGDVARIQELDESGLSEWLVTNFRYGRLHLPAFVAGYAKELRMGVAAGF